MYASHGTVAPPPSTARWPAPPSDGPTPPGHARHRRGRLGGSAPPRRRLAGEAMVVADGVEVLRQPVTRGGGEPRGGSTVEALAVAQQHGLVGHISQQGVLEDAARRNRRTPDSVSPEDELADGPRPAMSDRSIVALSSRAATLVSQNTRPTTAAHCRASSSSGAQVVEASLQHPGQGGGTRLHAQPLDVDRPATVGRSVRMTPSSMSIFTSSSTKNGLPSQRPTISSTRSSGTVSACRRTRRTRSAVASGGSGRASIRRHRECRSNHSGCRSARSGRVSPTTSSRRRAAGRRARRGGGATRRRPSEVLEQDAPPVRRRPASRASAPGGREPLTAIPSATSDPASLSPGRSPTIDRRRSASRRPASRRTRLGAWPSRRHGVAVQHPEPLGQHVTHQAVRHTLAAAQGPTLQQPHRLRVAARSSSPARTAAATCPPRHHRPRAPNAMPRRAAASYSARSRPARRLARRWASPRPRCLDSRSETPAAWPARTT